MYPYALPSIKQFPEVNQIKISRVKSSQGTILNKWQMCKFAILH